MSGPVQGRARDGEADTVDRTQVERSMEIGQASAQGRKDREGVGREGGAVEQESNRDRTAC